MWIKEIPYIESGDWSIEFNTYFLEGKTVAFVRLVAYFDESCSESVLKEETVNYYDNDFDLIYSGYSLKDIAGKSVNINCKFPNLVEYEIPETLSNTTFFRLSN